MTVKTHKLSTQFIDTKRFTLLELIVVLALMALILGITAPALAGFTKSRAVNEEARRFIAATRYAASEAASRGESVTMTILAEESRYEITSQTGALDSGINQTFTLSDGIVIEGELVDGDSTETNDVVFTPTGLIECEGLERILFKNRFDEAHQASIIFDANTQRFIDESTLSEGDE